jgi:ketosteroid isomerase-like protein
MTTGPQARVLRTITGCVVCLLPSGCFALTPAGVKVDVSTLLFRQTQQFSEAAQRGDGRSIARYLDDRVIFFNETGEMATKTELSANGPPLPGIDRTIATTDWKCRVHGNVAVASFVDVVEQGRPGHRVRASFRSVETWLKEGDSWKMIGSETLTLHQDPPSLVLSAELLQQYAGSYVASSGLTFILKREANGLVVSIAGGPAMPQKAEAPGILFIPGSALREVIQRNAQGRVSGFILLGGARDLWFRRIG